MITQYGEAPYILSTIFDAASCIIIAEYFYGLVLYIYVCVYFYIRIIFTVSLWGK